MQIDIDRLNEAELIALNLKIVSRLRLLWQIDAHNSMLGLKIRREGVSKTRGAAADYRRDHSLQQKNGQHRHVGRTAMERCALAAAKSKDTQLIEGRWTQEQRRRCCTQGRAQLVSLAGRTEFTPSCAVPRSA
jgi:hypothetical protein